MKSDKSHARKDMRDLKKGVVDKANTAKEIAQDTLHDVKKEIKKAVKQADENKKFSQKKADLISSDIKKGFHNVAKDINKTTVKASRRVAASNKKK